MLSRKERRFIRNWEEQRKGSRAGYYTLYICIWFFISMLGLFFLLNDFIEIRHNSLHKYYMMLGIAAIIAVIATHLSYRINERRFQKIIRREMDDAKP